MIVASTDGIDIAYDVHGTGTPAIVLVHGWSCDRTYWSAQLQPFAREFTVVAVDLAGHGESGAGRDAWTMDAFGGDVAAVVNALGVERVVLVGHSMGGDVIAHAARRLPGRVAGLIWVDVYNDLSEPRTRAENRAFVAAFRTNFADTTREFVRSMFAPGTEESLVERVAADMSAAPVHVAISALEQALNGKRETPPVLRELRLPVVAINSDNAPTDAASLQRYGIEPVIVPGLGHFLMMEDPERFNPILRAAIDKLAPRGRR